MWIFTPIGFFSVVEADGFPGAPAGKTLMVRARDGGDLDRLREAHFPELGPNVEMQGRDYPVRAFTTHEDFAECMSKLAMAIDYGNFKNAVSARQGHARASVYGKVWQDCLKIQPAAPTTITGSAAPKSRTAEYRKRDLHAEGEWPAATHSGDHRYGGVVFDGRGRVLLREPSDHYDGYHWTFPKGKAKHGEHQVDAALREVREETGHEPEIIDHVRGVFTGGNTGSSNYFYLMLDTTGQVDPAAMKTDKETSALQWADQHLAGELISKSMNLGGRDRDLRTLAAAFKAYEALRP